MSVLADVVEDASDAERDDRVMRERIDKVRRLAIEAAHAEAARWAQSSDLEFCYRSRTYEIFDYRMQVGRIWHEFDSPLPNGTRGFSYRLQTFRCRECFVNGRVEAAIAGGGDVFSDEKSI